MSLQGLAPPTVDAVSQQWHNLCRDRRVHPEVAVEWWEKILQMYLEPHRAYHTVVHLQEMFGYYRQVEGLLERKAEVQFAIFFHDIVYDPKASDNEEKSALMFKSFVEEARLYADTGLMSKCSFPQIFVNSVVKMILIKQPHQCSADKDLLFLLDMRLAILGTSRRTYSAYAHEIRREMQHVGHTSFCKARAKLLASYLGLGTNLYQTDIFRDAFLERARENLKWEQLLLRAPEAKGVRLTIGDYEEVAAFQSFNSKEYKLSMTESHLKHCLALSHELCLGYREKTESAKLVAVVLGTKTERPRFEVQTRMSHEFFGDNVVIHMLLVRKDMRGQGFATALLKEYIEGIRRDSQSDVRTVTLVAPLSLESFFKPFGFETVEAPLAINFLEVAEYPAVVPSSGQGQRPETNATSKREFDGNATATTTTELLGGTEGGAHSPTRRVPVEAAAQLTGGGGTLGTQAASEDFSHTFGGTTSFGGTLTGGGTQHSTNRGQQPVNAVQLAARKARAELNGGGQQEDSQKGDSRSPSPTTANMNSTTASSIMAKGIVEVVEMRLVLTD